MNNYWIDFVAYLINWLIKSALDIIKLGIVIAFGVAVLRMMGVGI